MIKLNSKQKIIIAGPCAAESRNQILKCAKALKKQSINAMRACLWKPRTQPGFSGVGALGIPWLKESASLGLTVATEVLLPHHVTALIKGISQLNGQSQMILWLGSRNQNHFLQQAIAKKLLRKGPKNSLLMIKNQPWEDKKHWLGIFKHVLEAGFPENRILFCHRGFAANNGQNPNNFRNAPNYQLAMEIKKETGRPMLLDPSHIGGSVDNVIKVVKDSLDFDFDGYLIESHPCPNKALTDSQQQLSINGLKKVLKLII